MLKNMLKWRTTMRIKELCQGQSVVDHPTSIFIYGHDREKAMQSTIIRKQTQNCSQLVESLVNNMTQDGSLPHLKQSTLVTLGYVCAETFHHLKQDEVDSVLAVIFQGMNQSENTAEVSVTTTNALFDSLDFFRRKFDNEVDSTHIINVVCERAFSEKAEIRQAAFECLVSIALKYHKLSEEYKERLGNPDSGDSSSPQFIKKALPHLIPMLLGKPRKPEEGKDHSGDVLRISMTARKCLCLVSRTGGDEIVHIAIPFILENILEIGSWRHREAAISAFESILDGSTINKLSPHVTGLLRFLLPAIKDENKDARETNAWTLNHLPHTRQTQSQIEEFQQHHRVTGLDNTISASQQPKVIEKLTVSKKKSLIELMSLVRGHLNSNGELEKEMWKIFLLEEEKSQTVLMKFLSAKDFSVKKSLKMLKNTLKWRTTMRIKELCQGQSVVDHPTSIFIYGHDREGHAVVYDNVYNDFPKKIFDDRAELDRTVSSFLKT
ncbi:hypothetical protein F2Q68_00018137 [Brassica cretica]|uniref:CRAL/TRIO N-terminal domain-containing protein n=1 Tax=Brassica cretica TaxID=69181 RepID=A0A8S9HCX0_BRACR|nr:hypothetical protein F2Q68_00018137 [Brassica cretica]